MLRRLSVGLVQIFCLFLYLALGGALAQAQWFQLNPTGGPPPERDFGATTVFDPTTDSMILFGGNGKGCSPCNDVWVLSHADGLNGTPAWTQLSPTGGPPTARANHSAVYDVTHNRMIIFGGCEGGCLPVANDVWVLSNANGTGGTPTWTQLSPSGGPPPARQSQVAAYDPNTNTMIIFGGQNGGGVDGVFPDTWVLSNANGLGGTPAWTQLSTTGGPPAGQYGPVGSYNPSSNRLTVFGGSTGSAQSTAVWTLSNANGSGGAPVWTQLIGEGASGSPATGISLDNASNPGGDQLIEVLPLNLGQNDAWVLSHADGLNGTPAWTHLTPTGGPSNSQSGNGQTLNPATGRLIFFLDIANGSTVTNQVWVLPDVNGATQLLATIPLTNGSIYINSPSIDTNTNRMYTAGGASFDSVPVQVIDLNTNTTVGSFGSGTAGVRVNSANNTAVFGTLSPSNINVYDISGTGVGTQAHTPFAATGCAIEAYPDTSNNRIWGASQCGGGNGGGDPIIVIDGNSNTVINPNIGSNGVMGSLVVNSATHIAYIGPSNVSKEIDPSTFVVSIPKFSGVVQAVNPSTNRLYAAVGNTSVQVIDGSNESVLTTITGFGGFNAIAVNPTRNRFYVLDGGKSPVGIDVFDGSTNNQIGFITVGTGTGVTGLGGLDVNPITGNVYVSVSFNSGPFNLLAYSDNFGLAPSTTSLNPPSPNPSSVGQLVSFTATVTGGAGTPSGSVTFLDGGNAIGISTIASSKATFSTSSLSIGTHSITASYSGDSNYAPSTSAAVTQTVNPGTNVTTTTLTSSLNPSGYNQAVTFTASVSGVTPTGTVTFNDGGSAIGSGTLNASAQATLVISSLGAGSHSITAAYGGDGTNSSSTSSALAQTVNQASTSAALTSSVNPSQVGQAVTFTVTITGANGGTPTGSVTFKDGAASIGSGTLNASAKATFTTSSLANGSHSITAVYGGDTNFTGSTSSAIAQAVNQVTGVVATIPIPSNQCCSIAVNPTNNHIYTSGGATFSPTQQIAVIGGNTNTLLGTLGTGSGASVNPATNRLYAGQLSPSAILVYDISGSGLGNTTPIATIGDSGCAFEATVDTSSGNVWGGAQCGGGNDPIIEFDGNNNVLKSGLGSGGVMGNLIVNPASHKLYIGPSGVSEEIDPATYARTNTTFGNVQAVNAVTNRLYAGTGSLTQVIDGSNDSLITTIPVAASSIAVNTSNNRVYLGDATANPFSIHVYDGGSNTLIGSVALPAAYTGMGGMAVNSSTGLIYITLYNGSWNVLVVSDAVSANATTTSLTASPNPSTLGQSVTLTATIASSGSPTGSVTFNDGTTSIGTAAVSSGTATLNATALSLGSHSLTAAYGGDSQFAGSTSTAVTQNVGQGSSTTTFINTPANPSVVGQALTFTAQVVGSAAGINPTGTVTFLDNGSSIGTATLAGGTAALTTSSLPVGTDSITASYGGDSNFTASTTSSAISQVVQAVTQATTTALASSKLTSTFGDSVTFTATVTLQSGGSPANAGNVTFLDGSTALSAPVTVNSSGQAAFTTASLSQGTHSITASYGGVANSVGPSVSGALTQQVNGKPQYYQPNDYPVDTVQTPRSIVTAQFDSGDSNKTLAKQLDIAVSTSNGVAVLIGNGDGTFQQPPKAAALSGSVQIAEIAAADFNGDGKTDLAVANAAGNLVILPGNGDGTFGAAIAGVPSVVNPIGVAAGDFGNGEQDLAVIRSNSASVTVLINNGSGTFSSANYTLSSQPVAIAVGDVTGVGNPLDIVTVNQDGSMSFLAGNGDANGTFGPVLAAYNCLGPGGVPINGCLPISNASSLTLAKLQPSRHELDAIVTSTADYNVRVLLGDGNGIFGQLASYQAGGAQFNSLPSSIAVTDLDGDGNPDLLVPDGQNVSLLFGNGDGSFQPAISYEANNGANAVIAGDFTGNGSDKKLSLAVANQLSNDVDVILGNGDGSFQGAAIYDTGQPSPGAVAVGDFNDDGLQDQVVANRTGNSVTVFLRKKNGTFHTPGAILKVGVTPEDVQVASFRNNNVLDIATANFQSNDVTVLLGNGNGTFTQAPGSPFSVGAGNTGPRSLQIRHMGDCGANTFLDIVITNQDSNTLSILCGDGRGNFPSLKSSTARIARSNTGTSGAISGSFAGMAVADINGNGKSDMITANSTGSSTPGSVLVTLDSIFGTPTAIPVGKNPVAVISCDPSGTTSCDLNGDGKPDIVVANKNDGTISVLINTTDTNATTPSFSITTLPVGLNPSSVALINLDGRVYPNSTRPIMDIVVANGGENKVATLSNDKTGTGNFGAAITYNVGTNPQGVTAANFGGGGTLDLGSANLNSNNVSVLTNSGSSLMTMAESVSGGTVTFTVNLAPAVAGGPVPSGSVTFNVDGAAGNPVSTVTSGCGAGASSCASFQHASLGSGSHTISALFLPAANSSYNLHQIAITTQGNLFLTTTSLSSSLNPALFGQSVNFSVAVSSNAGTPTGKVVLNDTLNGVTTQLASLNLSNGHANFVLATLPVGNNAITATYSGDTANTFASSSAPTLMQAVSTAATTVLVAPSVPSPQYRQAVMLTATASSSVGTPQGSITFADGNTTLGSALLNGSGVATLSVRFVTVGVHPITAIYAGQNQFGASTSSVNSINVVAASTNVMVSSSFNPAGVSQPVTFSAHVTSLFGQPTTGTVTFFDGGTQIGATSPIDSAGDASVTTSFASVSTHTITATYSGDTSQVFAPDTSSNLPQNILNSTATALATSGSPSNFNQSITLTATVTPTSGSGTPTGTVEFFDGSTDLGPGTLSSGTATLITASLSAGTHSLTASYNGDGSSFAGSLPSNTVSQVVTGLNFNVTLSHPAPPRFADIGQPLTFTSTVTNNTASSVPNVTFTGQFTGNVAVNSISSSPATPCSQATLSCQLGTVGAGAGGQITVTIVLTPLFPTRTITGTAIVNATTPPTPDPLPVNVRPLPFRH